MCLDQNEYLFYVVVSLTGQSWKSSDYLFHPELLASEAFSSAHLLISFVGMGPICFLLSHVGVTLFPSLPGPLCYWQQGQQSVDTKYVLCPYLREDHFENMPTGTNLETLDSTIRLSYILLCCVSEQPQVDHNPLL